MNANMNMLMMKMTRLCLMLTLLLAIAGCTEDQPASPQPGGSTGDAGALLPLSFFHVRDSDGGKPQAGVDVVMVFEPNGIADLYVARDAEAIAHKGSYTFKDGRITLKFTSDDFKPDVTFTIDTSQATVTMPFKAFSTTAGTSTWRRERRSPEENMQVIFNAATLAENLTTPQAVARVAAYANALKTIAMAGKQVHGAPSIPAKWKITDVKPLENGVSIQYANGPYLDVELFNWTTGTGKELAMSPIAADPRVALDPTPPHDGSADPYEKTALFIAPFDGDRETVTWYDYSHLNHISATPSELVQQGMGTAFDVGGMTKTLETRGYNVQTLRDADADIIHMIEALTPGGGRLHSPGFVMVMTHGNSNGTLFTGTLLGTTDTWRDEFKEFTNQLKARGYGDLLTYGGGTEEKPATIQAAALTRTMRPVQSGAMIYGVVVTPKFWEWLRTRGADFSRSLVFMAACLTDINPELRDAVRARAYFAFDVPVYITLAAKIVQYFCTSLARPTHTAEETYYNLIRVANTQQMIYKEDVILTKTVPDSKAQGKEAMTFFRGYAYNGSAMVSYMSGGWLGSDVDQGAVWWLLFGGRWGQDANAGAQGMLSCWQSLWKDGQTGGLGDQLCHNKAPGRAPTQNEVALASYLLSGKPVVGAGSLTLLPRWTLNDAR